MSTQPELFAGLPTKPPARPDGLRVISLTQPWATLCAVGAKRFETRSWSTSYRGRIAIAAAKAFPPDCRALCERAVFGQVLREHGVRSAAELPLGAILSVGWLDDCISTGRALRLTGVANTVEEDFGDYSEGRFAFKLRDMVQLPRPVPCRGALSIWVAPEDVERAVLELLGGIAS